MTRTINIKILAVILLAGFVFFNLILITFAAPPADQSYPYKAKIRILRDALSSSPCESGDKQGALTGEYNTVWCIPASSQPTANTTGQCSVGLKPIKIPDQDIFWCIPTDGEVSRIECPKGSSPIYGEKGEVQNCVKPIKTGEVCLVNDKIYDKDDRLVGCRVEPTAIFKEGGQDVLICAKKTPLPANRKCPTGTVIKVCDGKSACVPSGFGKVSGYTTQIKIPCDPKIIGSCPSLETPAGYIARIYIFGLMIAGLAAFGGIIYGSLKYVLSAGNIGSQQDAKDQITNTVLGLVLLLGAYIVLYTINPDLVNLRNPQLEVINLADLRPVEEEGGEQRLIAGKGGDDPLCASAINARITVGLSGNARTGQEIGQTGQDISGAIGEFFDSGGEKRGSVCLRCSENAAKNDAGICDCINNTVFSPTANACVSPKDTETIKARAERDAQDACNSQLNHIWRNGKCVEEKLGF